MVAKILYEENMGVDLLNHRGSTPAFRVWGGPTMEYIDLEALTKCIDYALDIAYGMFVRKSVSI
jgi:phosphoserine aminotransferase